MLLNIILHLQDFSQFRLDCLSFLYFRLSLTSGPDLGGVFRLFDLQIG